MFVSLYKSSLSDFIYSNDLNYCIDEWWLSKSLIQLPYGVQYLGITTPSAKSSRYSYLNRFQIKLKIPPLCLEISLFSSTHQLPIGTCFSLYYMLVECKTCVSIYLTSIVYSTPEHWENKWTLEWQSRNNPILKPQTHRGCSSSTLLLTHLFLWVFGCLHFLTTVLVCPGQGVRWGKQWQSCCAYYSWSRLI